MSIFLQKLKSLIILTALLGFAFVANAQSTAQQIQMLKNTSRQIEIPTAIANITTSPSNGSASLVTSGANTNQGVGPITYTPNTNFTGTDYFQVVMQLIGPAGIPSSSTLSFEIEVLDGLITTKRDYVSTIANSTVPVHIFPLDNDISTSNDLHLKPLSPIYNDGAVEIINDDEIKFTPNNGFKGITHLGYIACDDLGTCEKGMVSILVHDYLPPATIETGTVLTSEEQAIPVLMPYIGFEIDQAPSNGGLLEEVAGEEFVYIYTPASGFSGVETFSFVLPGNDPKYYEVEATVMNIAAPNQFAMDDYAYTPVGKFIEVDVVENDLGNALAWSLTIEEYPSHGNAWKNNDKIHYVPDQNFEGIDQVGYSVMDPYGNIEYATLYLTASNFYPALTDFYLTAVEETELVLSYHIPLSLFNIEIIGMPSQGEAFIGGNNEIHYIPNSGASTDQFTLRYNVDDSSFDFNIHVDIVPNTGNACSGLDCVWAGDTNRDGIVNGRDALLMCAIGEVGKARQNANLNWQAQQAANWNEPVSGINGDIKFVDTDGDSLITTLDIMGVDENYGKVHNIYPQAVPTQQNPLIFIPNATSPQPGDTIAIDVMMGTAGNPALDYSGISFEVLYNNTIFDTAWVAFNNHSWLGYDAPVLAYSKYAYDGKVDVAFTRGNETTKSGFGIIGTVYIVVDEIQGIRTDEVVVNFSSAYALDGNGHTTKLNDSKVSFQMNTDPFKEWNNVLTVYPNPATDFVDMFLKGNNVVESVRILDLMGKEIRTVVDINEASVRLDVSGLQTGMYILDVETDKAPLTRKLLVVRY